MAHSLKVGKDKYITIADKGDFSVSGWNLLVEPHTAGVILAAFSFPHEENP